MKIQITRKHINAGKMSRTTLCPIALALKKCGFKNVRVGNDRIIIDGTILDLSRKEAKFVEDFDNDKPVKPFVLNLKFA